MSDTTATDDAAATIGTVVAAATMVAAAGPAVDGTAVRTTDAAVLAGAIAAVLAVAAGLARRHGLLERRPGALLGALAGAVVLLASIYGLNVGVTGGVDLGVASIPYLLLATVGGAATVAAAAADYGAVPRNGIYRRAAATAVFSGVGAVGFLAMAIWMDVLVVLVVSFAGGVDSVRDLATTHSVVISQAGTVLGVGSVAVGYLVASDRGWGFLDLRMPTLRDAGYVVGGFVAIMVAALGLNALLQATGTESAGHSVVEQAEQTPEILLVLIPAAILVIGPFEELLYRNVIQKSLYDTFSRPGAVVAASVPFAIVHFPAYSGGSVGESLASLGVVLSLSLLLGAVYERTDNLLVPATVHGLYNATLFLFLYLSLSA